MKVVKVYVKTFNPENEYAFCAIIPYINEEKLNLIMEEYMEELGVTHNRMISKIEVIADDEDITKSGYYLMQWMEE